MSTRDNPFELEVKIDALEERVAILEKALASIKVLQPITVEQALGYEPPVYKPLFNRLGSK